MDRAHSTERPWKCEICNFSHSKRWGLDTHLQSREHKRNTEGPQDGVCDACGEVSNFWSRALVMWSLFAKGGPLHEKFEKHLFSLKIKILMCTFRKKVDEILERKTWIMLLYSLESRIEAHGHVFLRHILEIYFYFSVFYRAEQTCQKCPL